MKVLLAVVLTGSAFAIAHAGPTTQPTATTKPASDNASKRIAELSATVEELEQKLAMQAEIITALKAQNEGFAFQVHFVKCLPLDEISVDELLNREPRILPPNPKAAPAAGDAILKSQFVAVGARPAGTRLGIRFENVSGRKIKSIKGLIDIQDVNGNILSLQSIAVEIANPIATGKATSIERTWHWFDDVIAERLSKDPRQVVLKWGTCFVEYDETDDHAQRP